MLWDFGSDRQGRIASKNGKQYWEQILVQQDCPSHCSKVGKSGLAIAAGSQLLWLASVVTMAEYSKFETDKKGNSCRRLYQPQCLTINFPCAAGGFKGQQQPWKLCERSVHVKEILTAFLPKDTFWFKKKKTKWHTFCSAFCFALFFLTLEVVKLHLHQSLSRNWWLF